MKIELLKENEYAAREKWKEYATAFKKTRDPLYNELKKVYHAIKGGKAVIDLHKVISGGGIREKCHPNLAVAPANQKKVFCRYYQNGDVMFSPFRHWPRHVWKGEVTGREILLRECLPKITQELRLEAPIPIIPPRLRPATLSDDYFILWEVDNWTMTPSKDPYLLRRISKNIFLVCAAWDLTDIEMAVMAGRIS